MENFCFPQALSVLVTADNVVMIDSSGEFMPLGDEVLVLKGGTGLDCISKSVNLPLIIAEQ